MYSSLTSSVNFDGLGKCDTPAGETAEACSKETEGAQHILLSDVHFCEGQKHPQCLAASLVMLLEDFSLPVMNTKDVSWHLLFSKTY